MYCPVCFSDSLQLSANGIIHVLINQKKRDNGRFLFDKKTDNAEEIKKRLKDKVEEFFKWYSTFSNREPINELKIYSQDFHCTYGCNIPLGCQLSVIGSLYKKEFILEIVTQLANKYGVSFQISLQDLS